MTDSPAITLASLPLMDNTATPRRAITIKRIFKALGPGVVTGAADDDPSGIATYSVAGAQLGMTMLWAAWITWPLMTAIQMMCARIGMVTGQGLAQSLRHKFPQSVIVTFSIALLAANIINIGADLAGMADAAELLSGWHAWYYIILFGAVIGYIMVRDRYEQIASVLKWLAMSLIAYIFTACILHPDWGKVGEATFSFSMPHSTLAWQTLVAILGTTISPYLFFWQTSQEVEQKNEHPDDLLRDSLFDRAVDVTAGTLLSNIVMFFIILTTALTLHAHGMTSVTSSKEAAEALRPLAGNLATLLYTVGIIAAGLLAIPTLAGSSAYAFADTFGWKQGLDKKLHQARPFYAVILLSLLCGIAFNALGINPIKALFWTAIINGLLAPFLMVGILLVARDKTIMHGQQSGIFNQIVVALATLIMFGAAIGMAIF